MPVDFKFSETMVENFCRSFQLPAVVIGFSQSLPRGSVIRANTQRQLKVFDCLSVILSIETQYTQHSPWPITISIGIIHQNQSASTRFQLKNFVAQNLRDIPFTLCRDISYKILCSNNLVRIKLDSFVEAFLGSFRVLESIVQFTQ